MKKKILMGLLLIGLFIILPRDVLAAENIDVSKMDSITVSDLEDDQAYCLKDGNTVLEILSVASSNEKIATVDFYDDFCNSFLIFAKGTGTCNITITDERNCKKTVKVIVTPDFFREQMKSSICVGDLFYGSRKIEVECFPNCTGVLKIRKDKYKFTIGASGEKTIKLKRLYKLNEKATITLKKCGVTATKKYKIESNTNSVSIKGSGKKLKLKVYNLHKGDIIKMKHRGKTYRKKITRNYNGKRKVFSFKTKKKVLSQGDIIKVTIYNKSKKKLDSTTFTLRDGYDDPEEMMDDEYNA